MAEPAFEETVLTGFTRAKARFAVVSEQAGRVKAVYADVGEQPKDGILAQLDDTFTALDKERNLKQQARVRNNIAYLEKELLRQRELLKEATISQATYDSMENRRDQAKLELAELEVAAAVLDEQLSRFKLRVPKDMRVISRTLEVGQWVPMGTVTAEVGHFETLYIPIALDPTALPQLQAAQDQLSVYLPDFGKRVPARIARISPAFDPTTRKVNVDLAVDKLMPHKRGGLRAELTLQTPAPSGTILLPETALVRRYDAYWITREGGEEVEVNLRRTRPDGTVLLQAAGLKPGDRFLARSRK